MSISVCDFYSIIRTDNDILSRLSAIEDGAVFIETIGDLAKERGIILTAEEIGQAMSSFDEVIQNVANDDELTDFELELVAAGVPIVCQSNDIDA